jgi:fibronectin-binding autotransporter adhesin
MSRKSSTAGTRRNLQTSRRKRARVALASGAAATSLLAMCAGRALATVYTYTPDNLSTDTWSGGTGWTPSAPVSNTATELTFVGINTTVLANGLANTNTDNISGAFSLNILDLQGTGPASSAGTITIAAASGDSLDFDGASDTVNLAANNGVSTLTYNVSAPITLGATTTFQGAGTATFNFSGVISSGSPTAGITMNGTNTLTLSASNSYTGPTTINSGILALSTATSSASSSAFTVNPGAQLSVLNSSGVTSAGTLVTRSGSLTLNGGKLNVSGSSAGNTDDVFGNLTLGQGAGVDLTLGSALSVSGGNNVILVVPNPNTNTLLDFGTLSSTPGGTVVFSGSATVNGSAGALGVNIGTNTIASATAGQINIRFATAPTLIGQPVTSGGTLTTIPTTVGIIPNATSNSSASSLLVTSFVTYDPAFGVRTIPSADYASNTFAPSSVGTLPQNVLLTGEVPIALGATSTVNSLIMNFASTETFAGTLVDNSGALLFGSGASPGATISGGTLQLGQSNNGAQDAFITVRQTITSTIDSVITGPGSSNNLTIGLECTNASATMLVLGATNTYAGGTIINSANPADVVLVGGSATAAGNSISTSTPGLAGGFGTGPVSLNNVIVALNHSNTFSVPNTFTSTGTSTIEDIAGGATTLSGNISGTTGVTVNSTYAGSFLTLLGTNSYTGNTTISTSADTLQIGGTGVLGSGSYAGAISYAGTLEYSSSANQTFAGILSGAGALIKDTSSASVLTLSAINTFTGGTTISAGTVQIAGTGQLRSGNYAGAIADNGTLEYSSSAAQTFGGVISGAGSLQKDTNTSTLSLSGTDAFTGNTTISAGTVQISGSGQLGSGTYAGSIADNGTLEYSSSAAQTFSGVISGTGNLAKDTNSSTLNLSGINTYTGNTTISSGTLQIGGAGQLGSGSYAGTVSNAGTIEYSSSANQTLSGVVSGTGALTKDTSTTSILTLSAVNTFSGNTTISAGTLQIAGAGQLGSGNYAGSITNNGTLEYSSSANQGFSGVISGAGNLIKDTSTSVLTLSGSSSYTGSTTVNAGTLNITGSAANTLVTVNSGGTLSGSGVNASGTGLIGGAVSVNGGGSISLAAADATKQLTVNGLTLGSSGGNYGSGGNATLTYAIGSGSPSTGVGNVEAIDVGTAGTVNGTVNVNTASAYVALTGTGNLVVGDTYDLINSGSIPAATNFSLSSSTPSVDSMNIGVDTETLVVAGNELELTFTGPAAPGVAFFKGGVDNVWSDYSGSTTNWSTDLAGLTDAGNTPGINTDVILNASNKTGTVSTTLGTSTTINSLNVNGNGTNTIASDGSTLTIMALADANTSSEGSPTYTGNAAGNGISIASTANAFTIQVPIVLGNSQTWTNASNSLFTVTGAGGTITSSLTGTATQTLTLANTGTSGAITIGDTIADGNAGGGGTLALVVNNTSSGAVTLSGSNTYSGGTTLSAGLLDINNASAIGTGTFTIAGGTIDNTTAGAISVTGAPAITLSGDFTFNGTQSLNLGTGAVSLGNNAGTTRTITTNGSGTLTIGGIAPGSTTNALTKNGTGTLNIAGSSSYTGSTTVNAGTLLLSMTNSPTGILSSSSALNLGGATLSVLGKTTGTSTQTLASTTLNTGNSSIVINNNTGTSTTLALNAITRNPGSVLILTPTSLLASQSPSSTEIITTTGVTYDGQTAITPPGSGFSYVGAGFMGNSGANTRYVQINPSGQFALGPSALPWVTTGGTSLTVYLESASETLTGNTTMYGVLLNNTTAATVTLGTGSTGYTLTDNGLLHINTGSLTIQQTTNNMGTLAVGPQGDLVINSADGGNLTISAPIIDNSTFGASSVTINSTSTGVTTFSGANTYSNGTYVNVGTLLANSTNTVSGSTGSGLVTIGNGGILGGGVGATSGVVKGGITVNSGGHLTAGAGLATATVAAAPGILNANYGTTTLSTGSNLDIKVNNVTGTAGTNWDEVLLSALNVSSGVNVNLYGLTASNVIGATPNFVSTTPFTLKIADVSGVTPATLTSEIPDFTINTSNFTSNNTTSVGSSFSLLAAADLGSGSFLELQYNATPEPGTAMLVLGGVAPMLLARRRSRTKKRNAQA